MTAAAISALLFAACFPGSWFSFVIFISLVPFFIYLSNVISLEKSFFAGIIFGAVHSFIIAYWVFIALYFHYGVNLFASILFLAIIVVLPVAVLYGIFALAYRLLFKKTMFFSACVVPSLWILFDFLRDLLPLYLPWGFAGYSLTAFPKLIQIADVAGVYGITFCIIAVNSLIAEAWFLRKNNSDADLLIRLRSFVMRGNRNLIIAGIIIGLMALYGAMQTHRWNAQFANTPDTEKITVRVVQGSFALRDRWDSSNVMEILEVSLKLTGRFDDTKKYVVVWPETVINAGGTLRDSIIARIIVTLGENNVLVFGGTRQGAGGETYNSAYYVSGKGDIKVYDKIILLPFAESTPWGIGLLGNFYEAPVRFNKGTLPTVATLERLPLGFSICFEKIYPWFIRKSVIRGAKLLVNISNDSWFGRSTNPYQSLDVAIMRAVENRRFMAVASNSGISAVITPTGACAAKSGLFTEEMLEADVKLLKDVSLYTKFGDVVLFMAIVIILVYMIFPGKKNL